MKLSGRAHILGDFLNTDLHFTNKYKYEGKGVEFLAGHVLEDLDPTNLDASNRETSSSVAPISGRLPHASSPSK